MRETFLENDAVVPWLRSQALIAPYDNRARHGCRQNRFTWSCESAFFSNDISRPILALRKRFTTAFASLALSCDALADETTILDFHSLLEAQALSEHMCERVSSDIV